MRFLLPVTRDRFVNTGSVKTRSSVQQSRMPALRHWAKQGCLSASGPRDHSCHGIFGGGGSVHNKNDSNSDGDKGWWRQRRWQGCCSGAQHENTSYSRLLLLCEDNHSSCGVFCTSFANCCQSSSFCRQFELSTASWCIIFTESQSTAVMKPPVHVKSTASKVWGVKQEWGLKTAKLYISTNQVPQRMSSTIAQVSPLPSTKSLLPPEVLWAQLQCKLFVCTSETFPLFSRTRHFWCWHKLLFANCDRFFWLHLCFLSHCLDASFQQRT